MSGPALPIDFTARRVEPNKRMVAGRFGWAIHRFPIKGGLPISAVIEDAVTRPNPLLARFTKGPRP